MKQERVFLHRLIAVGCLVLAGASLEIQAFRAQDRPDPAAGRRTSFLKLIDRPRVPLEATALMREDISFASEAGQRVPTLLFKRQQGSGRRPAVVVLHGTGGTCSPTPAIRRRRRPIAGL